MAFQGEHAFDFHVGCSLLSLVHPSLVHLWKVRRTGLPNSHHYPPHSRPHCLPSSRSNALKNRTKRPMRHQRSPPLHGLACFTLSLHGEPILLTPCCDFCPVTNSPKSASDQCDEPSQQPSVPTHPRASEGSEGYPSWLPRRPPPPDPGSTVHSSNGQYTPGLTPVERFNVGRKPTPRSVRVVSLQDATQPDRDQVTE